MVGYENESPAIVYTHTYGGTAEAPHAFPVYYPGKTVLTGTY